MNIFCKESERIFKVEFVDNALFDSHLQQIICKLNQASGVFQTGGDGNIAVIVGAQGDDIFAAQLQHVVDVAEDAFLARLIVLVQEFGEEIDAAQPFSTNDFGKLRIGQISWVAAAGAHIFSWTYDDLSFLNRLLGKIPKKAVIHRI